MNPQSASYRERRRTELCLKMRQVVEERLADGSGFSQVTVEDLATGAGVSRATFYVYFEDRADFLRQAAASAIDELTQHGSSWWSAVESSDADALRTSLAKLIATYRAHEGILTAVAQMAVVEPRVGEHYRYLVNGAIGVLERALRHGADIGATRAIGAMTPAALVWMVERACAQLLGRGAHESDEDLVEVLADVIAAVVYAHAGNRAEPPGPHPVPA